MKVAEVLEKVNNTRYWSIYAFEEDLDLEAVAYGLDVDRHRWYEVSTNVYKCEDGFVGVRGPSHLYSESMEYESCYCECFAEEFEPKLVIAYVPVRK